jgi:hypothetical protein
MIFPTFPRIAGSPYADNAVAANRLDQISVLILYSVPAGKSKDPFQQSASIQRERAGLETPRAAVDAEKSARACGAGPYELEHCGHGACTEEPLPGAEDHRKGQQPVFVDKVLLDQRLGEAAAPVDLHLARIALLAGRMLFTRSLYARSWIQAAEGICKKVP